jgi:hypothetical protein
LAVESKKKQLQSAHAAADADCTADIRVASVSRSPSDKVHVPEVLEYTPGKTFLNERPRKEGVIWCC